jgi:uncharacterized membrane protein YagU involved in acid resistance
MHQAVAHRSSALPAILIACLVAGTLDLTYAIVFSAFHGHPPMRIMQSVASGWLGSAAYEGGAATAALGVVSHYFIMFLAATTFYLASRRFDFLVRRPVISGIVFGLMMYLVMTFVVLPLSAFPSKVRLDDPVLNIANLLVHMFLVGVPISLILRRFAR